MAVRGPEGVTRQRALIAASKLFAVRGYHGTSTRDIANAVGVRQPTLYRHFASKAEILAELLDADLLPALERLRTALAAEGSPAARLHAYLQADLYAILVLPYDTRGLYNDDVLELPDFAVQATRRDELHRLTEELVAQAIDSGELQIVGGPYFVRRAISGLILEAMRDRGTDPSPDPDTLPREIADFLLRGTLADPTRLPDVQRASALLLDRWGSALTTT
ncbi:TetR/AcrR family transcriptional regulator [Nonomuraea bangladeshensis]|uniref:TetR/AcrR family transcriptional regulator n=1 Tax=Nonomuraea bangladeshensis TaxID=404385 RepID=UPI003C2F62AA